MRSSLSDSMPAPARRGSALALAVIAPLFLGGCVTGLAGAAGMALNAVSGGSGETGSSTARQNGPFDANSPRELQDALAQTDDRATPLCRQRLQAYRRAQQSAQDNAQDAAPASAVVSLPPRRCSLQTLCLPGADRPTKMMVCRNQAIRKSRSNPQKRSE